MTVQKGTRRGKVAPEHRSYLAFLALPERLESVSPYPIRVGIVHAALQLIVFVQFNTLSLRTYIIVRGQAATVSSIPLDPFLWLFLQHLFSANNLGLT